MVSNTTPEKDQLATQLQVVSGRGTISAQSGERNNQNKCEVSPAQSSWHVTGFKRGGGGGLLIMSWVPSDHQAIDLSALRDGNEQSRIQHELTCALWQLRAPL